MRMIYLDGEFVPASAATLPASCAGVTHGIGVFTTALWHKGQILWLTAHHARLTHAARTAALTPPPTYDNLQAIAARLAGESQACAIRIALLAGDNHTHVLISTRPAQPPDATTPLTLLPIPGSAVDGGLARGIKHHGYLPYLLAQRQAQAAGYDDALLLDDKDHISEAATGNIHLLCGDTLLLPEAAGALPGIASRVFQQVAQQAGLRLQRHPVTLANVKAADAVLFTNAVQVLRMAQLAGGPPALNPLQLAEWQARMLAADPATAGWSDAEPDP